LVFFKKGDISDMKNCDKCPEEDTRACDTCNPEVDDKQDKLMQDINENFLTLRSAIRKKYFGEQTDIRAAALKLSESCMELTELYVKVADRPMIKMIDYDGEPVPEELCTVGRDGIADDFVGCGVCFDAEGDSDCANCVIDRLFKEYARITGQIRKGVNEDEQ
jgi:hypothetical protein